MLLNYSLTPKAMKNKSTNIPQRKTTLKWDLNGELSTIDMARIIDDLSVAELRECKLACEILNINKEVLNLSMWW
tara:strand:+ start:455 stop:679 length:225 start_codon:yes stop_codon:yes gene_type:complete